MTRARPIAAWLLVCAVAPLGLPVPASGQTALTGTWCGEVEMMHVDAHGIGFNEHTFCDSDSALTDAPAQTLRLTCANHYPGAGGSVTTVPLADPVTLTLITLSPDMLAAHWGGPAGEFLTRCD